MNGTATAPSLKPNQLGTRPTARTNYSSVSRSHKPFHSDNHHCCLVGGCPPQWGWGQMWEAWVVLQDLMMKTWGECYQVSSSVENTQRKLKCVFSYAIIEEAVKYGWFIVRASLNTASSTLPTVAPCKVVMVIDILTACNGENFRLPFRQSFPSQIERW